MAAAIVRRQDPYLDEWMHSYIRKTAVKEFWRVAHWYSDPADLVQDGYLCYAKCAARYIGEGKPLHSADPTSEDKKWFMSLVKTTFDRHIRHTIAGKMRHGHEEAVSQFTRAWAEDPADPWEGIVAPQAGDASLVDLLKSLPAELQQLMVILAKDGADALKMQVDKLDRRRLPDGSVRVGRRKRGLRETTNQYYCRLLGLDPTKTDIAGQVRELLNSY